jgi:hypothetical protein
VAQNTSVPQPGGATVPLAQIPRTGKAPRLEDLLKNNPRRSGTYRGVFYQGSPTNRNYQLFFVKVSDLSRF